MVRNIEHVSENKYLTPLEQEILRFLSLRPDLEYHLRDLARSINRSVSGSHTAMKHLEGSDLILSRTSGKNKYYRVNVSNPSVGAFKIFLNISEAYGLVLPYSDSIEKAILYGSCGLGKDTIGSDVDIFILTFEKDRMMDLPRDLKGRTVDYRIVNGSEMLLLRKNDPGYINEVEKGIILLEV